MPKERSSRMSLLQSWIATEPDNFVIIHDDFLRCMLCNSEFNPSCKNDVTRHIRTKLHALARSGKPNLNEWKYDLTRTFVSSNIPLKKLENPHLKQFLEKWTGQEVPCESTLRKGYVEILYETTINEIRDSIRDNYIWVSVDETTDTYGRYIVNFIVGILNGELTEPYLLCTKELERPGLADIVSFVNNSLVFLWREQYVCNKNKFLVFLTDANPYMLKAGKCLRDTYPNLYHITCIGLGLNRVAEEIPKLFPEVNQLVSSVNKIFLKAPTRVLALRVKYPQVPLPPEPIITQWNTWLEAAFYYAANMDALSDIIQQFNPNDSVYIDSAQAVLRNPTLKKHLVLIKKNFTVLHNSIKTLETVNMPLTQSLQILENVKSSIEHLQQPIAIEIKNKFNSVLQKNPDLSKLKQMVQVFEGGGITDARRDIASLLKYCPLMATDVERSFALYKPLLTDRKHNFTMSNLEKQIIINFKYKHSMADVSL